MKIKQSGGFANLIAVIFLAFIATLIVSVISLKILVGLERTRSLSDTLSSEYAAESEINDVIIRFLENYPVNITSYNKTLADGTILSLSSRNQDDETIIDVLAKRPFSSVKLQLTKQRTATVIDRTTDIVLTLDCTGSMGECADPSKQNCKNVNNRDHTNMEELKIATVAFLQELNTIQNVNVRVGIALFTVDANWLTTVGGTEITPENNLPLADIIATVESSFQKNPLQSRACKLVTNSSTAQGSGLAFVNKYLTSTESFDKKQLQVLITDGQPNTATPYAACGQEYFVPALDSDLNNLCPAFTPKGFTGERWSCKPFGSSYALRDNDSSYRASQHSQDLIACMLADTRTRWNGVNFGQRSPDADVYVLSTFPLAPTDSVRQTFEQYATGFFDMQNATNLSNVLINQVLPQIKTSINTFSIRKVVP